MSVLNKVCELEWYLSIKAFFKSFEGSEWIGDHLSDLDHFHEKYEQLKEPKIVHDAYAIYSPLNAILIIEPGAEFNLPLGYILPDDFLWMQIYPDALLFCNGKTSGNAKAKGSVVKLVNISDNPIQFVFCTDTPLGLGMTKQQRDKFQKYNRIQMEDLNPVDPSLRLSFFVHKKKKKGAEEKYFPENFYMTVSKKDQVRFMVHRKVDLNCNPATDPIMDIITADDVWKYTVKSDSELPYDVHKEFEKKWESIAGKNGKEGIRYPFSTYYKIV